MQLVTQERPSTPNARDVPPAAGKTKTGAATFEYSQPSIVLFSFVGLIKYGYKTNLRKTSDIVFVLSKGQVRKAA
ncbi:hypothetical protein [Pedobacter sp. MW01-1-1]|uniref:hypothetical protein n=1 Tax=Pedobacter sp. MW01-1-1 TaxID=3383027 RepID=UPI003FF1173C